MEKPLNYLDYFEESLLSEEELREYQANQVVNYLSDLLLKYESEIEEKILLKGGY